MTKRTDAEWQALADRIAQNVMGYGLWDELPEEARKTYWDRMMGSSSWESDDTLRIWVLAYNRDKWWSVLESGCPDSEEDIADWQPHLDVIQALMAADKICDQGWDRELTRLTRSKRRYASFWQYHPVGQDQYDGVADTNAKAICLAIEKFMEASC